MALTTVWPMTSDGSGAVTYTANQWRTLLTELFTEGVLGDSFAVTQRALGANMTLDIAAGRAVVAGDDQANQGRYLVREDTATASAVTISTAHGSLDRIDLVGIQINDPSETGSAGREAEFAVVTGTAAASPAIPSVPDSFLVLASVSVPAGAASIEDSQITDARPVAALANPEVIATGSILNPMIANGSITTAKLAVNAVATSRMMDGAVTEAKLGSNAVTNAKLASNSVTNSQIVADAVQTPQIRNLAVTEAKIAAGAVTDAKTGAPSTGVVSGSGNNLRYARFGGIVHLWCTGPVNGSMGPLPAGFRPAAMVYGGGYSNDDWASCHVQVASSGAITVGGAGAQNTFTMSFAAA